MRTEIVVRSVVRCRPKGLRNRRTSFDGSIGGGAALEAEENEVGAAADTELAEKIRDVELDGALGDVELAGDFLVGEVLEEQVEDFLLAAAEVGNGIGAKAPTLAREDGVHEAGKQRARHPESAIGDEREGAGKLFAGLDVGEQALGTKAQQRIAVGFNMFIGDDDEARLGIALEDIGNECAGGLLGGMRIDDINLRARRIDVTQVGSQRGFELTGNDVERRARKGALKLAEDQRVGRQEANRQAFLGASFSHNSERKEVRGGGQDSLAPLFTNCYG